MRKIVLTLDSSNFGGIETHVLQLSKALRKREMDVEVLFHEVLPRQPAAGETG